MTWISVTLLLLLGGTCSFFLARPWHPDREYRQHLTREERLLLKRGQPVEKTHRAYTDVWHGGYRTGRLRIEPRPAGQLRFTELGRWQQFRKGRLIYEADYYPPYRSVGKLYDEDGRVNDLLLTRPVVAEGDTLVEERCVYLAYPELTDTLAVQHVVHAKDGRRLPQHPEFWSYDVAGRRPVPPGWRFKRLE